MWAETVYALQVPYDAIHTCEAARQKAGEVAKTPEFAVALRKRRKVEALFSELKDLIGLRRLRLRRIKFVREQFYIAAVAQNAEKAGAVPQYESATSDGNRARNKLPQEKHDPKTTPLRKSASSNRVFQHQRDISRVNGLGCSLMLLELLFLPSARWSVEYGRASFDLSDQVRPQTPSFRQR